MVTKHTQGPWKAYRRYVLDEHGLALADTWDFNRPAEEAYANADLIAAAPDMFDALCAIAVMPWGYCCCPPRMGDMEGKLDIDHCGECRDVRAAIAKVGGEEYE